MSNGGSSSDSSTRLFNFGGSAKSAARRSCFNARPRPVCVALRSSRLRLAPLRQFPKFRECIALAFRNALTFDVALTPREALGTTFWDTAL